MKPDKFDRMANMMRLDAATSPWVDQTPDHVRNNMAERAAKLLRRQHKAVVRLVKAQRQYGAWINVEELLAELARYRIDNLVPGSDTMKAGQAQAKERR